MQAYNVCSHDKQFSKSNYSSSTGFKLLFSVFSKSYFLKMGTDNCKYASRPYGPFFCGLCWVSVEVAVTCAIAAGNSFRGERNPTGILSQGLFQPHLKLWCHLELRTVYK